MKEQEQSSVEQAIFQNIRGSGEVAAAAAKPMARGIGEVVLFMAMGTLYRNKTYQRMLQKLS